jgi:hypothetical protein
MNRRALEGMEKVLGPEHPDMVTSVSNLTLVLQHQGERGSAGPESPKHANECQQPWLGAAGSGGGGNEQTGVGGEGGRRHQDRSI